MQREEFEKREKEIADEAEKKYNALIKEFLDSFPGVFKVGEYVQDIHWPNTIKIERVIFSNNRLEPAYMGTQVTTKKVPYKVHKVLYMCHSDVKKV